MLWLIFRKSWGFTHTSRRRAKPNRQQICIVAFRSATYDSYEESVGVEIEKFAQKDMEERRELEWYGAGVGEGEVADITVVGDGGWGKRSLGHSYDSPTGNLKKI